ncbi:MAG: NAD-dependent epimerase/dehydratase family protein, partial [Leptospira sp.]|nr:NAD-dependent epimerase/dehydratase family protein [Leptospira sp.]
MEEKKILITGATGYLGGRIFEELGKNYELILSSRKKKLPNDYKLNYKFVFLNLFDNDIKEILKDIDIIIHLASLNSKECQENILNAY